MSKEARRLAGIAAAVGCLMLPASASAQDIWDQNSGGDGTGFFSQQDTDPPSFLSEVADDFFLTGGPVTVRGVDVSGHYAGVGTETASSVTVRIYQDAGTVPFLMPLHTASEVVPVAGIEAGDFSIPISSPFVLAPGQYWISVQANGLDYPDQVWDWDNRPLNGMTAPAAARTTIAAGCMGPAWTKKSVAGCAGGAALEDQMFSLSSIEPTAPTPPTPPAGPSPVVTPPAGETGERAAALKKCKKKKSKKKRKKCRKRARRLPV